QAAPGRRSRRWSRPICARISRRAPASTTRASRSAPPEAETTRRRRGPSDAQRPLDAGHRVAAEPDRAVIEPDADLAVAAEAAPLTCNIAARIQHAVAPYQRRDAAVAAAAHRVFGDAVARRE